jgi:CubicO group peptidase (beta-lactamase class C family)
VRPRLLRAASILSVAFLVSIPALAQQAPAAKRRQRATKAAAAPAKLSPVEQRIQKVENGLIPTIRVKGKPLTGMTIAARMKKYHVAGLSIAVINDYAVEWSRGYGVADVATATPVDTSTRFQAGEVSETITALAALRLVEARKVDLNKDVNKTLKSWKLPKSDLTKKNPVTLRALLAHSAGLTILEPEPFNPGSALPTITQVLYGTRPATNPPVNSVEPPGQSIRYTAAGYDAVQQLIEDVTKRSFADFVTDTVLVPLGMRHSGFVQADGAHVATGHDADGKPLPGRWRIYPELGAVGLWSTPADLAQVVIEIQQGTAGRAGRVTGAQAGDEILTAEHVGWPGLGVMLDGREKSLRFRSSGANPGYETVMVGYVERGEGAVIMANTDGSEALIEEVLNAIAAVYEWPGFTPPDKVVAKVDPKVFDRFVGRYGMDSREISVAKKGNRLFIGPSGKETTEMLPESVSEFFTPESGTVYSFVFDENGKVQAFTQRQRDANTRWDRKS